MKKEVGLTYKLIRSDAVFNRFAIIFNILLIATLISLRMMFKESDFIDYENFELSKVTFRETMGFLTLTMGVFYHTQCNAFMISALLDATGITHNSLERIAIELALIYGFLTLAFYLMNLFGFFWGVIYLPISPPFLLLIHQCRKLVKESQD